MATERDYLTSPIGEIQYLALKKPVSKTYTKSKKAVADEDEVLQYGCRMKFDRTTKEGKAWYETITAINANIPGTKHVNNKETEYTVRAFSTFVPLVVDAATKEEITELPDFYYGVSTGKGRMLVVPFEGDNGGTIKLSGLIINELDVGEKPETGREVAMEKILAALAKSK